MPGDVRLLPAFDQPKPNACQFSPYLAGFDCFWRNAPVFRLQDEVTYYHLGITGLTDEQI